MYYIKQHIINIIRTYKREIPLHLFLKKYFSNHKKLGSRDRKTISEAVYAYYRVKKFLRSQNDIEYDIAQSLKALNSTNIFLKKVFELEKISSVILQDDVELPQLSHGIDKKYFIKSMLSQPPVFIRIINNSTENVSKMVEALPASELIHLSDFRDIIFKLPQGVKLQHILPESDYVVQDLASQLSISHAISAIQRHDPIWYPKSIWDVCCGAGGKTIQLLGLFTKSAFLATDKRHNILENFKARLRKLGFNTIQSLRMDIAKTAIENEQFDLVLCDVPCSGSGTWQRSPEQFYFFDESKLVDYQNLQSSILENAMKSVRIGGYLIYITCSVFYLENEEVLSMRISDSQKWRLLHQELIHILEHNTDFMFVSVFQRLT